MKRIIRRAEYVVFQHAQGNSLIFRVTLLRHQEFNLLHVSCFPNGFCSSVKVEKKSTRPNEEDFLGQDVVALAREARLPLEQAPIILGRNEALNESEFPSLDEGGFGQKPHFI